MHQTTEDMLRTYLYQHRPQNFQDFQDLLDSALASAIFGLRSTIHTTLKQTPGALAFNRDMLLNVPVETQVQHIQARRQTMVNRNAAKENKRRYEYTYHQNDQVLISQHSPAKLETRFIGPFLVTQVHTNGTITIQRQQNITQRINIRRVKPYFQ